MYGDPQRLRALAAHLEAAGHDVDAGARRLDRSAAAVRWQSTAAGEMQRRARAHVHAMRGVALRFSEAADAVRHHADAVEHQLADIQAVEARVRRLVEDLRGAGPGAAASTRRARFGDLRLPPPGHLDWLGVPAALAARGIPL